ncbi:MAG: YicC family protein [Rhodospirillales bacterium]|nr:MAG: YicC family protein [Rhodospirillales bacterium]
MTGFARAQDQCFDRAWTWEIRSVNGRGLEIRNRLPAGFEGLEIAVRERVGHRFKRGNFWVTLAVVRMPGQASVRINHALLQEVLTVLPEIQKQLPDFRPPSVDGILALRGIVEPIEDDLTEERRVAVEAAILDTLDRALTGLAEMRLQEGSYLRQVIRDHVRRIDKLCADAATLAAAQPGTILRRVREQIASLVDLAPSLTEERLAQEAAMLASRADPREEIDRLKAHCEAAATLLDSSGPVGRRLDFLCQEFNREANTLCAKSVNVALTQIGLELKSTIDQLREQVQNIE